MSDVRGSALDLRSKPPAFAITSGQRVRRIADWIILQVAAQAPNGILWWPVFTATGVGTYFALPVDPLIYPGPAAVFVALLGWLKGPSAIWRTGAAAIFWAAIGFTAADLRTRSVEGPMLLDEIGPLTVGGHVVSVEPVARGFRLTLDALSLQNVSLDETPKRVRVTVPRSHGAPEVGNTIRVRAVLRPPGRPVMPGGFDFQRYSYFRQLGGIGFSVGRWTADAPLEVAPVTWVERIRIMRANVGNRLTAQMPPEAGSVARALMTGERSAVAEPLQEAYRQSGLAHMLAISGLHMSLLAGLAFVAARRSLALVLPVAERFNTKKIAAVAALGAALYYLMLSGMNVPAQRAFIMVTVVFTAVLLDRTAVSLRTLALAAMLVLMLQPEALVGASFQLSFAAVLLLITVYERVQIRPHLHDRLGHYRPIRAVMLYAAAVLVTDLIATAATAPFTGFHFHEIPKYSLLANLLAVPVMGLWIMPWGMVALVLMPLGLDGLALAPMAAGIDMVNAIARYVSSLPGATQFVPQAPDWAVACIALGGVFVCLWRGPLRWLGVLAVLIGLPQPWLSHAPDVLVDETADVFAVKGGDGRLVLSPGRGDRFTRAVWSEAWGKSDQSWQSMEGLSCDLSGCVLTSGQRRAVFAFDEAAAVEDCGRAEVMIAVMPVWQLCNQGLRIDRFDVWRHGAHAVWLTEEGVRIKRVSDETGKRRWNRVTWRER